MSTFGIDGLSSGLDTTAIINQLMQLERQPVVRLENRQSANTKAITALGSIKAKLTAVSDAMTALTDATRSFMPHVAISSAGHVTATAGPNASAGSITFSVEQLAARHSVVTDGVAATRDAVVNSSGGDVTVRITAGGTTHDVIVASGTTLQQLSDQINAVDGLAVSANLVDTGSGIKLQLSSESSGAAGTFTADLSALDAATFGGSTATSLLAQGQDAQLRVGDPLAAGSYTVTSTTNTFTGLLDGLSLTATQATPGELVTVDVAGDPAALATRAKAFVDAVNAALAEMDAQTKTSLDGATPGALAGSSTVRALRDRLMTAITHPVDGAALGSVGMVGIQSTREGTLTFDEARFTAAVASDPAAVERLFRSGDELEPALGERVIARMAEATTSTTGTIATSVKSRETENRSLTDNIDALNRRLELRRATLTRQFTNLEIVMGRMQAQQSWLAGAIGQLNVNRG